MKSAFIILTILTWAAVSFSYGQSGGTGSGGDASVVEEIKRADRQWQVESYSTRDLKDYDRVVADEFLITGSNGRVLTKAGKRASVAADYTEFSPDDVFKIDEASHRVRVFGETAVSDGFIVEKYLYKGNKIDSRVYFTCTYLKRGGRWQVVAAHYTRINQK